MTETDRAEQLSMMLREMAKRLTETRRAHVRVARLLRQDWTHDRGVLIERITQLEMQQSAELDADTSENRQWRMHAMNQIQRMHHQIERMKHDRAALRERVTELTKALNAALEALEGL